MDYNNLHVIGKENIMAKKVCAVCNKKLGAFKKKIPYANKTVCISCAENMKCLVCQRKLRSTEAKILFNEGFFCPDCMKKTGITSFMSPKAYSKEHMNKFIEERIPLVQSFVPTKKPDEDFSIDEIHKTFKVCGDIFEYKNLLSFELIQDNQHFISGGLGRAILLGLAFGVPGVLFDFGIGIIAIAVGIILGATTGGKKTHGICNMMKIKITVKNAHVDTVYIPFVSSEIEFDSTMYKTLYNHAQASLSALEIIADYNRAQNENAKVNEVGAGDSEADEILKFKKLMEDGIITNEEFQAKKKQILNLPTENEEPEVVENPEVAKEPETVEEPEAAEEPETVEEPEVVEEPET